jgi:hypothetical protein
MHVHIIKKNDSIEDRWVLNGELYLIFLISNIKFCGNKECHLLILIGKAFNCWS